MNLCVLVSRDAHVHETYVCCLNLLCIEVTLSSLYVPGPERDRGEEIEEKKRE